MGKSDFVKSYILQSRLISIMNITAQSDVRGENHGQKNVNFVIKQEKEAKWRMYWSSFF